MASTKRQATRWDKCCANVELHETKVQRLPSELAETKSQMQASKDEFRRAKEELRAKRGYRNQAAWELKEHVRREGKRLLETGRPPSFTSAFNGPAANRSMTTNPGRASQTLCVNRSRFSTVSLAFSHDPQTYNVYPIR